MTKTTKTILWSALGLVAAGVALFFAPISLPLMVGLAAITAAVFGGAYRFFSWVGDQLGAHDCAVEVDGQYAMDWDGRQYVMERDAQYAVNHTRASTQPDSQKPQPVILTVREDKKRQKAEDKKVKKLEKKVERFDKEAAQRTFSAKEAAAPGSPVREAWKAKEELAKAKEAAAKDQKGCIIVPETRTWFGRATHKVAKRLHLTKKSYKAKKLAEMQERDAKVKTNKNEKRSFVKKSVRLA